MDKNMKSKYLLFFTISLFLLATQVFAATEAVLLLKVMDSDSKAIIERKNGEQYLIEYGVGVISIWRYEGKAVLIQSPGIFLGIGSSIILPNDDQKARIWDSKLLGDSGGSSGLPTDDSGLAIEDEISLFDSNGRPTAYIDVENEMTIYLWNGHPVAYLVPSNDGFSIYGFNGNHLGWLDDGIVRDHKGLGVGFVKGAVSNVQTKLEPLKKLKKLTPLKSLRKLEPLRPLDKPKFSDIPLKIFLGLGSKKDLDGLLNE